MGNKRGPNEDTEDSESTESLALRCLLDARTCMSDAAFDGERGCCVSNACDGEGGCCAFPFETDNDSFDFDGELSAFDFEGEHSLLDFNGDPSFFDFDGDGGPFCLFFDFDGEPERVFPGDVDRLVAGGSSIVGFGVRGGVGAGLGEEET